MGLAVVRQVHVDQTDHLDEVITDLGTLRGCTPGTAIYDAFEDMFRAAASLSSLSEVVVRRDGHAAVAAVDAILEHHAPQTVVHQLTLEGTVNCFFADGMLVKHRKTS
jgi:hypothetical protein